MKLSELLGEEEYASPTDAVDHMAADNLDQDKEVGNETRDVTHKDKAKIMKIGRGNNFKKAKAIAANAKADARAVDAENIDTPDESRVGASGSLNMRLT